MDGRSDRGKPRGARGQGARGGARGAGGRFRGSDRRGAVPADRERGAKPRIKSSLPRDVVKEVEATSRGAAARVIALLEQAIERLEADRPTDAVKLAAEAKAIASRSTSVRETLGLALYQSGKYQEAIRELQSYRRMTGRPDQNHLIADAHRAVGSPEKAIPLVEEALRARIPEEARAEAAVVGGAALADLGRYEEALAILRRFGTRTEVARPHDLRVWYVTGDVLEKAGRKREAAREFRRILEHDPEAFDAAERASALS